MKLRDLTPSQEKELQHDCDKKFREYSERARFRAPDDQTIWRQAYTEATKYFLSKLDKFPDGTKQ